MPSRNSAVLALTALCTLAVGVLVYALDRNPESVYFLPAGWSLADGSHPWFGSLGDQLPEFTHVYGFSLLTAVVFAWSRNDALLSCAVWWTIDSLFELGQHPAVSPVIAGGLPTWFEGVPFLENTGPFFAHGTFDLLDLVAITVGAVAAYLTTIAIMYIRREDRRYVECS